MSGDMATDHVNGNGTEEPMDTTAAVTHSEHFAALLEAGLPQTVAEKLDELYVAGKPKFSHCVHTVRKACVHSEMRTQTVNWTLSDVHLETVTRLQPGAS